MTLAVSVRIPDGVVLAVDSLSTVGGKLNFAMDAGFKCNQCGAENEVKNLQLPLNINIPVSTKSSAQKLLKFKENFGIACFGNSFVNKKSMLSQVKELESNIKDPVSSVDKVAEKVLYHFEKELKQELGDLSKLPETFVPFGFQVVGFDGDGRGKTWVIHMGRQPTKKAETELGTTYSGDIALVMKLLKEDPGLPTPQPNLLSFSLQDAVDYAKFLIRFVADDLPPVFGPVIM